jgi:hypothetical protein
VLLCAIHVNACSSWSTVPSLPESSPPSDLRLVLSDSSRVELTDAVAEADTIRGVSAGEPRKIAMTDVVEIERKGGMRTTVVFALVSVTLLVAFGMASSN